MWKTVLSDMLQTPVQGYKGLDFSLFGHGLGSFSYLSSTMNTGSSTVFASAHNEYLEIFYCCGIIGLAVFLAGIFYLTVNAFSRWMEYADYRKPLTASLLCSLLIICLCAGGIFVWHLGAHCYYSIVIAGLLSNKNTGGIHV
jgi:O-antigen ligase